MTFKPLGKWCTIALIVGLFLMWGSQAQQSAWQTQVLAEGPDEFEKRVLTPDIAVVDNTVYVSYVDQATETVWLLISTESGVPGSWKKIEVTAPKVPVANTTVAASKEIVCVAWQQLGDVGPEVWQRCASLNGTFRWLGNSIRVSPMGVVGGQHIPPGRPEEYSGGFDNAIWSSRQVGFVIYILWVENYYTLKAVVSTDGINWLACGHIPRMSGLYPRFPTIYVDNAGIVWVGSAESPGLPISDIQVWMSPDQCTDWKGPVNATDNPGFSDAPRITRMDNKLYVVNDDSTTARSPNLDYADINLSVCDLGDGYSAHCNGTRAIYKDAAYAQITTDGEHLHVAAVQYSGPGLRILHGSVAYCVSQDGGQTWLGDHVPASRPGLIILRDVGGFGVTFGFDRIAVGPRRNVYIAWNTQKEGKSRIMLSTRNTLPTGTPTTVCAP